MFKIPKSWHYSASALLAGYGAYKELWEEIPGTGYSVMGLVTHGYSRLEIAEYFPMTSVSSLILLSALLWSWYAHKKKAT